MTATAPAPRPAASAMVQPAALTITERRAWAVNGWLGILAIVVALGAAVGMIFVMVSHPDGGTIAAAVTVQVLGVLAAGALIPGIIAVQPGQARVIQFFGRYVGTVRREGLLLTVPLSTHRRVSVRVRNFESRILKVNDATGNPVELGAVVVWQVVDTAKATFAVERYADFVQVQAEAAMRHVAVGHPYDEVDGAGTSLRGSTDVVAAELAREVSAGVAAVGIEILEVRISHLAYAPEIAQAMLQRQQASAIIAARSRIVDGAVGMVEMALTRLQEHDVVELDEERKAAMVSNLLVVLCGDSRATPIVNTGTLYQ